MGFQDLEFLPSHASFYNTFLKNCGSGSGLSATTFLSTVIGGKRRHALCIIILLLQIIFLCRSISIEVAWLPLGLAKSGHRLFWGYCWI